MNDPLTAPRTALDGFSLDAIAGIAPASDAPDGTPSLPLDHPAWQRDVLSISARARIALASLRPLAITVLAFWDHRLREITLGARTLGVDASGCYRLH